MEKNKIFVSNNEKLMSEWNWEKNNELGLFPDKLAHKSNKKAWWKCCKGHSWEAVVCHRTDGQGCPYCSNRRLLVGYNDLETKFPELIKEWDFDQNTDFKPSEVTYRSSKRAFWTCSVCGYKWNTKIQDRTAGNGCPRCSNIKRAQSHQTTILKKKGGISDPLLLKEWNYEKNGDLIPQQVTNGSNKYVWWKCSKCGHEWKAKINNRALNRRGCPLCANRVVVKGKNDLATTHPQLAAEWHPTKNGDLTPENVTYGMAEKVWWLCPQGHEYQATINHRSGRTNCSICNSGRQTSFAEQAFYFYIQKIYPNAINRYTEIFDNGMELDIYIPSRRLAIEYDGVYWHKKEKKEREIIKYQLCQEHNIKLIRIKESEEIDCRGIADVVYHKDNLDNRNNLQDLIIFVLQQIESLRGTFLGRYPDVNLERDENEIRELYRTQQFENSLEKLYPNLAEEWNYKRNGNLLPSMFQAGSSERVWWKCKQCGHEWKASIAHRANGTGCNVCYRKQNRGGSHVEAKTIYQYSIEGKFIKKWECIATASSELKINGSNITMCAKHIRPNAGGFRWEYEYVDELKPTVKIKKSRKGLNSKPILQLDEQGNIIAEYNSLNDAAEKINIHPSNISKVLHGNQTFAGGYKWKLK